MSRTFQRYPTGPEFVVQSILGINHGGLGQALYLLYFPFCPFLNLLSFRRCCFMGRPNHTRYQSFCILTRPFSPENDAIHLQPFCDLPTNHNQPGRHWFMDYRRGDSSSGNQHELFLGFSQLARSGFGRWDAHNTGARFRCRNRALSAVVWLGR